MNDEKMDGMEAQVNGHSAILLQLAKEVTDLTARIRHLEEREGVEWKPTTDDGSGAGHWQ